MAEVTVGLHPFGLFVFAFLPAAHMPPYYLEMLHKLNDRLEGTSGPMGGTYFSNSITHFSLESKGGNLLETGH